MLVLRFVRRDGFSVRTACVSNQRLDLIAPQILIERVKTQTGCSQQNRRQGPRAVASRAYTQRLALVALATPQSRPGGNKNKDAKTAEPDPKQLGAQQKLIPQRTAGTSKRIDPD